jgi:hypothetical protein
MSDVAVQRGPEAGEGLLVLDGGVVVTIAGGVEHEPGYVVVRGTRIEAVGAGPAPALLGRDVRRHQRAPGHARLVQHDRLVTADKEQLARESWRAGRGPRPAADPSGVRLTLRTNRR